MSGTPENVESVVLYAWVGEDEYGSKEVGIKQGAVPAGIIPLVSVSEHKLTQPHIKDALRQQVDAHRKTIRLCKFVFQEEIIALEPGPTYEDDLVEEWRAKAASSFFSEAIYWSKLIEIYQMSMQRLNESVPQDSAAWKSQVRKMRDSMIEQAASLEAHFKKIREGD